MQTGIAQGYSNRAGAQLEACPHGQSIFDLVQKHLNHQPAKQVCVGRMENLAGFSFFEGKWQNC